MEGVPAVYNHRVETLKWFGINGRPGPRIAICDWNYSKLKAVIKSTGYNLLKDFFPNNFPSMLIVPIFPVIVKPTQ